MLQRVQQRKAEAADQREALREREAQAPVAAPLNLREQGISTAGRLGEHFELLQQQQRREQRPASDDFAASIQATRLRLWAPLESLDDGNSIRLGPGRDPLPHQHAAGRTASLTGTLRSSLNVASPLPPPPVEWFSPAWHASPLRPEPQLLSRRHPPQGFDRSDTPVPLAWPSAPPLELMWFTEGRSGHVLQPLQPRSPSTNFAGLSELLDPLPLRPEPQLLSRRDSQEALDIGATASTSAAWPSAPPLELMRFTEGRQEPEPRRRRKHGTSQRSPS